VLSIGNAHCVGSNSSSGSGALQQPFGRSKDVIIQPYSVQAHACAATCVLHHKCLIAVKILAQVISRVAGIWSALCSLLWQVNSALSV
jgi:hypothetical protein